MMPSSSVDPHQLITLKDAKSTLLSYMFSGAVGHTVGKAPTQSVLDEGDSGRPIDRHEIVIDRRSGEVRSSQPISLSRGELAEAVLSASGHHLSTFSRFVDGSFSISYKVSVEEDPDVDYIVQIRYFGDVTSMNAVMRLVSSTIHSHTLPVPTVYPIADEQERQKSPGLGLQITRFVPGIMGNIAYPNLNHEQKLIFVQRLALAFDALWNIPLPQERLIGELKVAQNNDEQFTISIGPDRYHGLGGPFTSVADYLRAYIRAKLRKFEEQDGIEEYKSKYLAPITAFVNTGMYNVPVIVEQIPVVALHLDLGLHNIIVSIADPTRIEAVIDWEFCASAPYASLHRIIETFFHVPGRNGFGAEYPRAEELRRAFWGAIPKWETWNKSEATRVFLDWFRFALFMGAPWRPKDLGEEEKKAYWAKDVQVVEEFLARYHKQ